MATHQSLSGTTDEEFVQRMVTTYPDRFDEPFWAFFTVEIGSASPADFVAAEENCHLARVRPKPLGCGCLIGSSGPAKTLISRKIKPCHGSRSISPMTFFSPCVNTLKKSPMRCGSSLPSTISRIGGFPLAKRPAWRGCRVSIFSMF